jgi:hypothetical protein
LKKRRELKRKKKLHRKLWKRGQNRQLQKLHQLKRLKAKRVLEKSQVSEDHPQHKLSH